ncbi:uncharacterized protein BX664DRAFT_344126 [Halteromyces radiatus]|uniref:uncharacterized protein n=1 Tax=Halteromyces radiatus TaxID=101107 RepID=UPI00221EF304|nr:uncharacterized protein BX664DRAFT_344126 [Halteromyces radiatus]KAI8076863.1 hypothetical protein BX664DRAFT_344126 [Halteromyces radiatus]
MTPSTFTTFTVLIKKIARKGTLRRKLTTKKHQQHEPIDQTTSSHDQDMASVSTCSTNEEEKPPITVLATTTKTNEKEHLTTLSSLPLKEKEDDDKENTKSTRNSDVSNIQQEESTIPMIYIRDFAYPVSSPLHNGLNDKRMTNGSQISLSSSRFNGCQAKALYDFIPETEYEIAMKSGQVIWIQYRQCTGWLIADVGDETGLVPESYIEFI